MLTLASSLAQKTFVKIPRLTNFNSHRAWDKTFWFWFKAGIQRSGIPTQQLFFLLVYIERDGNKSYFLPCLLGIVGNGCIPSAFW